MRLSSFRDLSRKLHGEMLARYACCTNMFDCIKPDYISS